MNKITTTAGLLALGAVSLKAQVYAPAAGSPQANKPWTVSAVLRGFYDDNYSTSPNKGIGIAAEKRSSFGFEISPSAEVHMILDQTAFSLGYVYSYRWYENREHLDLPAGDQAHQVNAKLSHAFSPRYKIDVSDSFALAQESSLLENPGTPQATFLRSDGDNLRNNVTGSFSAGITDNFALVFGYSNVYYDYDQEAKDIAGAPFFGLNSRSAVLDRVEHLGTINARYTLLPKTVLVGGYQFGLVDYTSHDPIGVGALNYSPEVRNNYSHYFYVGVDQSFTPTLNGSVRGGVQYTKYDDLDKLPAAIPQPDDSNWSPYVDANITWLYMPGSTAQLGVKHQRSQTDVGVVLAPTVAPILDAESTTVYASVNQRIFGGVGHGLVASLIGQYQHSTYDNDVTPSFSDDYFLLGVNLTYEINRWVAAEVGYNYDRLSSELDNAAAGSIPRSFTRNRVYIGVRGTY
jgi:hypothetical protein